jgi:hypothetical protein
MRMYGCRRGLLVAFSALLAGGPAPVNAGDLVVRLGGSAEVSLLGAIRHWDDDGKPRFPVDPKAKIDQPRVDARADPVGRGLWAFHDLAPGRYDLVLVLEHQVRVEGFRYPPISELDPFLSAKSKAPDEETRAWIVDHIARSKHYENKVAPLFMAGDEKQVRILVQLVRDQPTSYDAEFRAPGATVRHEFWQYTNNYGGWVKDKRTVVLDRILLAKNELRRWTWIWEPRLGGIYVGNGTTSLSYEPPEQFDQETAKGWFPY